MATKKKRRGQHTFGKARLSKLLKRVEREKRAAVVLRLRGNVHEAMRRERNVDLMVEDLEQAGYSGAASRAEERGVDRGRAIYDKIK